MVSKLQAYMIMFCKKYLIFPLLAAIVALVGTGCGTVGSVTTLVNQDYTTYVKEVDEQLKSSPRMLKHGYYLQESVKQRIFHESLLSIKKDGIESPEMNLLRSEYLKYTRALIEIGEFNKASMVCDQGIQVGLTLEKALEQKGKRDAINALSRAITLAVINTSIEPGTDNGAYLRRMFLYKTYNTWFTTGNKKKAFDEFEQFLKTNGANEDLIFLLMDRGSFYDAIMGDYRKSLDEFIRAAAEIEKMHLLNTDMRYVYSLEVSTRISDIYLKLGELDKAENALLQGEEQRKGILNWVGGLIAGLQQSKMTIIKSKQGALYALLRDFKKSKELFDAALTKVSSIDPNSSDILYQRVLGTYYVNYGAFYLGLQGKYKQAIESVDKGLTYLRPYYMEATENEPNIVTAHLYSGELHYLAGNEETALGNSKEAKEHYETALSRAKSTIEYATILKNQIAQANAYTLMGQAHYKKGDLKQAMESYEKALAFFKKPQGSGKELENTENWKLYYGLGEVYEATGDRTKALSFYEKAVDEVEKLWSGRFKDSQRQVSFIDNRLIVFEPMIRILAKQGKADEALYYMEKSKSRTFFETSVFNSAEQGMATSKVDLGNIQTLKASEIKNLLTDKMAILEYYVGEREVIGVVITRKNTYAKELDVTVQSLKSEVKALRDKIEAEHPDFDYKRHSATLYSSLIRPFEKYLNGIDTIGIIPHGVLHYLPFQALIVVDNSERNIAPELIEKERNLSVLVTCEGIVSRGIIIKETKAPSTGQGSSGTPREDCMTLLTKRGVKVSEKKGNAIGVDIREVKAELDVVRSQLASERALKGIKEDRPTFLIDGYKIFYAPSSTILNYVHLHGSRGMEKLLAVGSPPPLDVKDLHQAGIAGVDVLPKLDAAKVEVQEVKNLFPSGGTVFFDDAATKTVVTEKAPANDLILFSTHGMLNRLEPMKSAIFFNRDSTNDGRLTVREIENMSLKANLVVLSACQTGLMAGHDGVSEDINDAKFPHGDDLVGLQRAFLRAGASSVMSTLWEVADDSTSSLVVDFFKRFKDEKDKTAALREASLQIMNNKKWEHPVYWAPFVLSGDWR